MAEVNQKHKRNQSNLSTHAVVLLDIHLPASHFAFFAELESAQNNQASGFIGLLMYGQSQACQNLALSLSGLRNFILSLVSWLSYSYKVIFVIESAQLGFQKSPRALKQIGRGFHQGFCCVGPAARPDQWPRANAHFSSTFFAMTYMGVVWVSRVKLVCSL